MKVSFVEEKIRDALLFEQRTSRLQRIGSTFIDRPALVYQKINNWLDGKSKYNPDEFWKMIVGNVCSPTRGPDKIHTVTKGTINWVEDIFEKKHDKDGPSVARFIDSGRNMILHAYQNEEISPEQRKVLADLYKSLVHSQSLERGWKMLYANYMKDLEKEDDDLMKTYAANMQNDIFGIIGSNPIIDENGQHIFTKELINFVNSDVFNPANAAYKDKLIKQAREQLISPILHASPEVANAFESSFIAIMEASRTNYGALKANTLTQKVDGRKPTILNEIEDRKVKILSQISSVFEPVKELLLSDIVGLSGRSEAILDNTITLLDDIVVAISENRDEIIQSVVYQYVSTMLLDILKKKELPKIRQMYEELVKNKLHDGRIRLANDSLDPDRIETAIDVLLTRLTDDTYGIGGVENLRLTDTFIEELNELIGEAVKREESAVKVNLITALSKQIKKTVIKLAESKERQKVNKLIELLDKAYSSLEDAAMDAKIEELYPNKLDEKSENKVKSWIKIGDLEKPEDIKQNLLSISPAAYELYRTFYKMMTDPNQSDKDTLEKRAVVFDQAKEMLSTGGIREEWKTFIEDITNQMYGVGEECDISPHIIRRMGLLRDRINNASAEDQYVYYDIGKRLLIDAVKNSNTFHREAVKAELDKLLNKNVLKDGKKYIADLMIRESLVDAKYSEKEIREYYQAHGTTTLPSEETMNLRKVVMVEAIARSCRQKGEEITLDAEKAVFLANQIFYERNTQNRMKKYWDQYLADRYDPLLQNGALTDITRALDSEHQMLVDVIKTQDITFTGGFIRAGLQSIEEIIAGPDISRDQKQRLIIEALDLVSTSKIAVEMGNKEVKGDGTKYRYSLGALQAQFIRLAGSNPVLVGALRNYISSRVTKNHEQERIALSALSFSNDNMMRRKANNDEESDFKLGQPPMLNDLVEFDRGLQSAYESITKLLKDGNKNAFMNSLAVMVAFSPYTVLRIGLMASPNRTLKDSRHINDDSVSEIQQKILTTDLSPAQKCALFYAMTGKLGFDAEAINRYVANPKLAKELSEAVKSDDGKDLFDALFKFKDDLAQISGQPGIASILSNLWTQDSLSLRKYIFEKYITTVEQRITDSDFNSNDKLVQKAGLELLAMGMMFENTDGEDEAVKTTRSASVFSKLLVDILINEGSHYNEQIVEKARQVVQLSMPYWSLERIQTFTHALYIRAGQGNDWIENNGWKNILMDLAYVNKAIVPDENEKATNGIRTEIAEEVCDVSLSLLSGYTTLGGRQGLKSPFEILTGEKLVWGANYKQASAGGDDFIRQVVGMVSFYGTDEQKTELKKILTDLGRQDLIKYAIVQCNPGFSQTDYLKESRAMLKQMETRMDNIEVDLAEMFDRRKLARPMIKVDVNGRIIGLSGSELLDNLHAQEQEALEKIGEGLEKTVERIQQQRDIALGELNLQFDWESLLSSIELHTKNLAGKTVSITEVLNRMENIANSSHGTDRILEVLQKQSESSGKGFINIDDAARLYTMLLSAQGAVSGSVADVATAFLNQKGEMLQAVSSFLSEIGVTEEAKEKEKLQTIIDQTVAEVLIGDKARIATMIQAKALVEATFKQEIETINALLQEMQTDRKGVYTKASRDDVELMKMELEELRNKATAEYKRRSEIITKWGEAVQKNGEEIGALQEEFMEIARQEIINFKKTIVEGVGKGGRPADRLLKDMAEGKVESFESVNQKALLYHAAVARLGNGIEMSLNMADLKIDSLEVLEALGLEQEYMHLTRKLGFEINIDGETVEVKAKRPAKVKKSSKKRLNHY